MVRKESFYALSHGTDKDTAKKIIEEGFLIDGDTTSWCGEGIYFYDIKAKAWWAAERKCAEKRNIDGKKVKPAIILVDIDNIDIKDIFDLRVKRDLEEFEKFTRTFIDEKSHMTVSDVDDEVERKIVLRSLLIAFYARKKGSKLVVGNFRQRPQPLYEHAIEFANSLDMVFGIETIYCVKNPAIISNIRIGGNEQ